MTVTLTVQHMYGDDESAELELVRNHDGLAIRFIQRYGNGDGDVDTFYTSDPKELEEIKRFFND